MDMVYVKSMLFLPLLEEPFKHWEISNAMLYQEPTKAEYLRRDGIFK